MRVEDFPKSHRAILVTKITTVIRLVCFYKSLAIFDTLPFDTCLVFLVQKWNSRKDRFLLFSCDAPQFSAEGGTATNQRAAASSCVAVHCGEQQHSSDFAIFTISNNNKCLHSHGALLRGWLRSGTRCVEGAVGGCSLAAGSGNMSLL